MDDAPMLLTDKGKPDTTARHILQALAEHAHRNGTGAHPSILRLQYRTGYDRRTVQRALRRLEDGDLIKAAGSVQGRTQWRLSIEQVRPASDWAALEAEEEAERSAATERQRRSRARRVTHSNDVTVTHADAVTEANVTHANDVSHALKQRDVTHSASARHALNAALTTNQPPLNQLPKDTPPPAESDSAPGLFVVPAIEATPAAPPNSGFDEFWTAYPKKVDKGHGRKAYTAAIKRGITAATLLAAARAHAEHHHTLRTPRQYIPNPATWLNGERYDDELPAAEALAATGTDGRYSPYSNPADQSAYDDWE
jgi:DNA-binding transcriptional ArsR family regulator